MAAVTPRVGVCSFGRTGSQRCPNKMLRPFGETTLTDLVLEKLAQVRAQTGTDVFFAGWEPAFRVKCAQHGVPFVQREARSAQVDEPITEILSFLREVPHTHLLLINGCLPFLRTETIAAFLRQCLLPAPQPAFAVLRRANYFMTLDRQPLNFDPGAKTLNTKTVRPVYEFAHALYFFERDYFFREGTYWDWQTVRLIEMPGGLEARDIDTEEDFQSAAGAWRARTTAPALARS